MVFEYSETVQQSSRNDYVRTLYPSSKCSVILRKRQTRSDLVEYLHAACLGPVKSTFLKAIKTGFFKSWSGLSEKLVTKHLHSSTATAKGHLSQTRQHLQSTEIKLINNAVYLNNIRKNSKALKATATSGANKSIEELLRTSIDVDAFPPSDIFNAKTNEVIYTIFESSPTGLAYIDLTEIFTYRYARGNENILVGYHFDANAILSTALKNYQAATITAVWTKINNKFKHARIISTTCILDNEASQHLRNAFTDDKIKHQLVPPHVHRTNLAERAVQMFK